MIQTNNLPAVVKVIIEHQIQIIGPMAIEQANKVPGLKVSDGNNLMIEIKSANSDEVLTQLINKYEELFGKASVEVCKDAIKELKPPIPPEDLPNILH